MSARKARGNTVVSFNGTAITAYCDQADVDAAIDQIETTNLASTGAESTAGDPKWSIKVGGMWDNALDAVIGPEAVTPGTKRTAYIAYTGSSATITYTWTSNAEIENYTITSQVGSMIKWSGTLALSGAPSRT